MSRWRRSRHRQRGGPVVTGTGALDASLGCKEPSCPLRAPVGRPMSSFERQLAWRALEDVAMHGDDLGVAGTERRVADPAAVPGGSPSALDCRHPRRGPDPRDDHLRTLRHPLRARNHPHPTTNTQVNKAPAPHPRTVSRLRTSRPRPSPSAQIRALPTRDLEPCQPRPVFGDAEVAACPCGDPAKAALPQRPTVCSVRPRTPTWWYAVSGRRRTVR